MKNPKMMGRHGRDYGLTILLKRISFRPIRSDFWIYRGRRFRFINSSKTIIRPEFHSIQLPQVVMYVFFPLDRIPFNSLWIIERFIHRSTEIDLNVKSEKLELTIP